MDGLVFTPGRTDFLKDGSIFSQSPASTSHATKPHLLAGELAGELALRLNPLEAFARTSAVVTQRLPTLASHLLASANHCFMLQTDT